MPSGDDNEKYKRAAMTKEAKKGCVTKRIGRWLLHGSLSICFSLRWSKNNLALLSDFVAALQTIKCLASKKRDACCCCRYRQISRDLSNVTRNAGVRPCLMRQAHRHLYTLLYLRLWLTIGRHSAAAERRSDARLTGTGNTGRRSTADGRVNKSKSAAPNESGPSKLPFCWVARRI